VQSLPENTPTKNLAGASHKTHQTQVFDNNNNSWFTAPHHTQVHSRTTTKLSFLLKKREQQQQEHFSLVIGRTSRA